MGVIQMSKMWHLPRKGSQSSERGDNSYIKNSYMKLTVIKGTRRAMVEGLPMFLSLSGPPASSSQYP